MKNKLNILYILLFIALNIQAQDKAHYQQKMLVRATNDSILLRWAPLNYATWRQGIKNGYTIERHTLYANNTLLPNHLQTVKVYGPIIPMNLYEMEELANNDDYVAIAAEAMYGTGFELNTGDQSSIISFINAASEQQNRFSFALFAADISVNAAKASGLYYADKEVEAGEKYLYRIYVNNKDTLTRDTAYVFTGIDELTPLPKPIIQNIAADDKLAAISWHRQPGLQDYTAFYIERSGDKGQSFKRVNEKPFVNVNNQEEDLEYNYYMDTLPENNKRFVYRIQGISPFGLLSPYSDTTSVKGFDRIKELPVITDYQIKGDSCFLLWDYPKKEARKITGFQVYRALKDRGKYQAISRVLDRNQRSFIDPKPLSTSYYKIKVLGKHRQSNYSHTILVQLPDSTPPKPPSQLQAEVDSSGLVYLHWKANTEQDIYGYRVYRGNSPHEEFSQLTVAPIKDTLFIDKLALNTLNDKIYYQVLATDNRQNFSQFSKVLELERPDTVPPSAPVINYIQATDSGINIGWINGQDKDLADILVFRQNKSTKDRELISTLSKNEATYCDKNARPGQMYYYAVVAMDKFGNSSGIANQKAAKIKETQCLGIKDFIATADRTSNRVTLEWKAPACAHRYIIYRGSTDEPVSIYKTLTTSDPAFEDRKVVPETNYTYGIKAISTNKVSGSYTQIKIKY